MRFLFATGLAITLMQTEVQANSQIQMTAKPFCVFAKALMPL